MRARDRFIRLVVALTIFTSILGAGAFGPATPSAAAAPEQGVPYGFGDNYYGQLGTGTEEDDRYVPTRVGNLSGVIAIAAGADHSLVLAGGVVYSVGGDDEGQLGDGTIGGDNRLTPAPVVGLPAGVTAIAAGRDHSLALVGGVVYSWGNNTDGELGNGVVGTDSPTPTPVAGLPPGVTFIAAGHDHSLAIVGGVVYTWGNNDDGQLGHGVVGTDSLAPDAVAGLTGVTAVAGGNYHSLALRGADVAVFAWGDDDDGQLGDGGTNTASLAPVQVVGPGGTGFLLGATAIAAGDEHNLAIVGPEGALYAWGYNADGQLGDSSEDERATPVRVVSARPDEFLTDIVAIAGGDDYSLAVRRDGVAFSWGSNESGNLGNFESVDDVPFPLEVIGIAGVTAVSARDEHSLVIASDPVVALGATNLAFGGQTVGTTSAPQALTLTNTGGAPLAIGGIAVAGNDFAQANNCPALLVAGASCTINVTFTPLFEGARSGTLTVTDSAEGSPRTVALSGVGAPATATFTVAVSQLGSGTVSPGTGPYPAGSVAAFSATPAAGQVFLGWTLDGEYAGYAPTLDFTVNGDRTLVARFAARPSFGDVPVGDADRAAIEFLAALGVVNPAGVNGSGRFEPGREVVRAEVAAFIARLYGWDDEFHRNTFPDKCDPNGAACIDDELWNNVAALADYGVVGGYTDPATCASAGTAAPCYLPRDPVQRVQVVSVVARAFIRQPDLRPTGSWDRLDANPAQYTNVPNAGTQRSDLTTYRANAGPVPGQASDGTFPDPTGAASRRFVIQALWQAFSAQFGVDRAP